jgi:hypothetical protein
MAKLTNLSPFIRFPLFMVAILLFPEYPRVLAYSILGVNLIFMLVTASSLDDIEFRVTFILEEVCLFLYSALLVVNVYDDMSPYFGLIVFWVIGVTFLLCYLVIMLLEFYIALHTIIEALNFAFENRSI